MFFRPLFGLGTRESKKYGKHSRIRTAIREEPMKLAQYLRDEKGSYASIELKSVVFGANACAFVF